MPAMEDQAMSNPQPPAALSALEVKLARDEAHRSAEMVDRLPAAIFAQGISPLMQLAGMESFFAQARTLIEFLLVKPAGRGDWTARHTLGSNSTWAPNVGALLEKKLITTWTLASQHLMHFSSSRAVPLNYGQADLEQIADEVL